MSYTVADKVNSEMHYLRGRGRGGVSEHTCTCTSLKRIITLNLDGLNNNTSLIV